jgi:hypothetical protein
MSVDPWMLAWPRSARIPPPGRPMLPSSSWMIEAARMFCTPVVCCVQPTEYTIIDVRSGPELAMRSSTSLPNSSSLTPQVSATNSGV